MNDDDNSDQSKLTMYRMVQSLHEIKDKLLVLVMNSTIAKVDEEESASMNDVHTQVKMGVFSFIRRLQFLVYFGYYHFQIQQQGI